MIMKNALLPGVDTPTPEFCHPLLLLRRRTRPAGSEGNKIISVVGIIFIFLPFFYELDDFPSLFFWEENGFPSLLYSTLL